MKNAAEVLKLTESLQQIRAAARQRFNRHALPWAVTWTSRSDCPCDCKPNRSEAMRHLSNRVSCQEEG